MAWEATLIYEQPITIVSGCAGGADKLGERYAKERGYELQPMPAQWYVYGRSAGYKRNAEMAAFATHLLAFWDRKSRGTRHMVLEANKRGLGILVYDLLGNKIELKTIVDDRPLL